MEFCFHPTSLHANAGMAVLIYCYSCIRYYYHDYCCYSLTIVYQEHQRVAG